MQKTKLWQSKLFWKTYILNITLLCTILGALLFIAYIILPDTAQDKSKEITDQAAKRVQDQLSIIIEDFKHVATYVQSDSHFLSNDPEELKKSLEHIVSIYPLFDSGVVLDKEGVVDAYYPEDIQFIQGTDLSYREYFQEAKKMQQVFFSKLVTAESDRPIITMAVPIMNQQHEVVRVLSFYIRIVENDLLQSMFQNIDLGADGYAYLVDQSGRLISHPLAERIGEDVSQNEVVQQSIQGFSGYQEVINTKGVPMYASYQYVPILKWGIIAQVPVESTQQSFAFFKKYLFILLLILILPFSFIITWFTKRIILPIQQLNQAIDQVSKGNFEQHIESVDDSEIGQLTERFNRMIDSVKEGRKQIKEKQDFLRKIIDMNPNYIFARNQKGQFTIANKALAQLYGATSDDIIGKHESYFNSNPEKLKQYLDEDKEVLETLQEVFVPEDYIVDKDGNERWVQTVKIPIISSQGNQVLSVSTDITDRKVKEQEVEHLAFHDDLTGLANRTLFQDRLTMAIEEAEQSESKVAVMFLDLDGFKSINDTLGHTVGDCLLQIVAERLKNCVREEDTIARMGGDEFTVILPKLAIADDPLYVAKRIIEAFEQEFKIDHHEIEVTTSIGISIYPEDGRDAETIIQHADTAMYSAKENGKNNYQVYHSDMSDDSIEQQRIESNLHEALNRKEPQEALVSESIATDPPEKHIVSDGNAEKERKIDLRTIASKMISKFRKK